MYPHIGVLQALQDARGRHQQHVLARFDPDHQRNHRHIAIAQQVVEQMIAVIRPQIHVALAVMQAVKPPPPVELMAGPVIPVIEKIEHEQVDEEAGDRMVGHAGPQVFQIEGLHAFHVQRCRQLILERIQKQKNQHRKRAEAMDHGIQKIDPARTAVTQRMHRDQRLQRPQYRKQQGDLADADQEPFGALERLFGEFAHAEIEDQRLHHGLEQPALHEGKQVDQMLDHGFLMAVEDSVNLDR